MKKIYLFLGLSVIVSGGILAYWQYDNVDSGENMRGAVGEFQEKTTAQVKETATQIPIVMYHYVREVNKIVDPLGWNLSINPADFEKQLK